MKKQNHTTKTNKSSKSRQSGFSPLLLILIIVIVLALGFTGWFIWQRNQQSNSNNNQPNTNQDSQQPTNNNNQQPTDPTENGKYLVIEEWGVRFELPEELRGGVSYNIDEPVIDPDGNRIQKVDLLLIKINDGNVCAINTDHGRQFIESAIQIIRAEKDKPFDINRYRGTFKYGILEDDTHTYSLNYVMPDCAGGDTQTAAKIQMLHRASETLTKYN